MVKLSEVDGKADVAGCGILMNGQSKDLLGIAELTKEKFFLLWITAESFKECQKGTLRWFLHYGVRQC
jgi:hypothetical protein